MNINFLYFNMQKRPTKSKSFLFKPHLKTFESDSRGSSGILFKLADGITELLKVIYPSAQSFME